MCTSLTYRDAQGSVYFGRTLELNVELPYVLAYVPEGQEFRSQVPGSRPVEYTAARAFFVIATPDEPPAPGQPLDPMRLMAVDGVNTAGLTFSLLAYPSAGATTLAPNCPSALQAKDLGSWVLGQFAAAPEVADALKAQPVFRTRLGVVGGAEFPFHMAVHDRNGANIIIEWQDGEQRVYNDPVGVMTNGPEFGWHLTNLGNWTHLNNVDRSSARFGSLPVSQPDAGIATASLPSSNTSVGRFVRAVYYTAFAQVATGADEAMLTLSRIMNNFDRPRGITTEPPSSDGDSLTFEGSGGPEKGEPSTEYTSFTVLTDLARGLFLVRTYSAFNYTKFDLNRARPADRPRLLALAQLDPLGGDGMDLLLGERAASEPWEGGLVAKANP